MKSYIPRGKESTEVSSIHPSCNPLVAPFVNPHMTLFYRMFTYIYSLLVEKGISSFCVFVFVCSFIRRSRHFSSEFSLSFYLLNIQYDLDKSIFDKKAVVIMILGTSIILKVD